MTATGAAPRLLIIETSGRIGHVALAEGDQLRAERRLDEVRRHARDLAPAVADLLAALAWQPRQVDAVLVSRGPGSYTGLRVGLMSAKTFAFATGCTLLGLETFAAIALQAPPDANCVDVIADAQQGKVYVQRFEGSGSGVPLRILAFGEWLVETGSPALVSGPGLRVFRDRLPAGTRMADEADWEPRPESLLRLGLPRYRAGERDDVWSLEPIYLRSSAAEEQWDNRSGARSTGA